ncbi:MAG: hypothetical protein QG577_406 [Thermodesulfobacteriota bacterium]|nr:hypothetical protein [Thermodesulfobacteriota bacterium]
MLTEYLAGALEAAEYEIIEDEEPFYGQIQYLPGVWATGKSLEQCRHNLREALEDWVLFSVAQGLDIPQINGLSLNPPKKAAL